MNICTITGNVGRDCEVRYTPAGKAVASFSIGNQIGWGENKKTAWFRCTLWGERATKLSEYIKKGMKLTVSGEVSLNEYESNGEKRASLELNVREVELPPRNSSESQQQVPASQQAAPPAGDDFNDSIPF